MLIKKPDDIKASEITPKRVFLDRREFIGQTAAFCAVTVAGTVGPWALRATTRRGPREASVQDDELTAYEHVTGYNNFYEFGTGKEDPARNAHTLRPPPVDRDRRRRDKQAGTVRYRRLAPRYHD